MDRRTRWTRRLAVATVIVTYALVIMGSTVRVTESGMGCPGWPLCYGTLGPIDRFHTLLEEGHRYLAALTTVLVIATAVSMLRRPRLRPFAITPAIAAVGVVIVQIVLGGVTVLTHNAPWTVAAHLLTGLVLLSVVTVTTVAAFTIQPPPSGGRRLGPLAWVATAGTLVLLLSGSLVVDGGASDACRSWPLCSTPNVPAQLVALQLVHRSIAVVVGLTLLAFVGHAWRRWSGVAGARSLAGLLAGTLGLTGGLGAATGVLGAPPAWQDAHLASAAAVLAMVVALSTSGWLAGADARYPGAVAGRAGRSGTPTLGGDICSGQDPVTAESSDTR